MATDVATTWADLLEGEEIAYAGVEPARDARSESLPDDLDPRVASALVANGVTSLYRHQAETWEAARRGENVVVTTGTASGKSLAFNLPVLDAIAREPKTRALYLYPTKALAQDQARALAELRLKGLKPAIYDGDTPGERRWQIRKWSNLILTNPDMLHVGVLPHHDRWGDVLHNLRYVVVDEAHVYRGVFGSHVANVLRRLRRLARIYEAEPQFLLASATIANAGQLAEALTGEPATVVESDTSPRAEREVVIWNPPLLDAELGLRASALGDASRLMSQLTSRGLRTICFAKSRKAAELIHRFTVERVNTATASRLAPYRAGYTAEQRTRHRAEAGRRRAAGRDRDGRARARHRHRPARLRDLGRVSRHGRIAPAAVGTSRKARRAGWRCSSRARTRSTSSSRENRKRCSRAGWKPRSSTTRTRASSIRTCSRPRSRHPFDEGDAETLGKEALRRAAVLPELERTSAGFVWKGRDYPAARISLRSGDGEAFTVIDGMTGSLLGLVERERAYSTVHEGAVYLHLGEQYLVERLDHDNRVAVVVPASVDWYTQVKKETETTIEEAERVERRLEVDLHFGRVSVSEQVVGYARKAVRDGSTIDVVPMLMPETTFETEAIWFSPEPALLEELEQMPALLGTLHAAEHTLDRAPPAYGRCATAGTSGASPRTSTTRPAARRSSSTTATRAAWASPRAGSRASRAGSRTRCTCSSAARARAAARRACRARSAGT